MSESQNPLDIDPSVEQHLRDSVEATFENPVPSKTFGDESYLELPNNKTINPGETPQEAHERLQKENGYK